MAHWIKCTTVGGIAKDTFLNLDTIVTVTPQSTGSRLIFSDGHMGYVDVTESPASLLASEQVALT